MRNRSNGIVRALDEFTDRYPSTNGVSRLGDGVRPNRPASIVVGETVRTDSPARGRPFTAS
ncbi:hypothetical protein [Halostagnicola kamekurae]|uniref:hypothetical protein n=1 Tax=Halostagnicola kamekurae TaxID=619731 RepID=UPI000B86D790|nr:hypothetical protein [Halostagnicola kamekurae]